MSADWAAFSSLAFLPAAAALAWKGGRDCTFWPEIVLMTSACYASIAYHACCTSPRAWCPDGPAVATDRDVALAYLALVAAVAPCLHVWVSARARCWYALVASGATVALVFSAGDSYLSMAAAAGLHLPALAGGAYYAGPPRARLRVLSLFFSLVFALTALLFRVLSYRADASVDSTYLQQHALWHLFAGVAATLLFLSLEGPKPVYKELEVPVEA